MINCLQRDKHNNARNKLAVDASKLRKAIEVGAVVSDEVLQTVSVMRADEVTDLVKRDGLLLYVAQIYLERNAAMHQKGVHVRERLRSLAKVVKLMGASELSECLLPGRFVEMARVVRENFQPTT